MRRSPVLLIVLTLILPAIAWSQVTLSPPALLKEAEHQQQVLGNADSALEYYRRVLDHEEATPPQKAQARLGMTVILVDLGRLAEAEVHADWLAANMPDSPEATAARARLAQITLRDPADLMPAETHIYMELVQPGRQLEQILAMLQDAGLDESLEELMNGAQRARGATADGPPLGMILNPSLLGELKKIEGLACGVTKVDDPTTPEDDPEFIGILLPGRSQAVRGLVQMLLTMGSESVETLGENTTLHQLAPGGQSDTFAAITPEAILVGRPRALVMNTIARLEGDDATEALADQERFQRQAGARRQDSVMLMYVDVHKLLAQAKEFMDTHEVHELTLLNELADIEAVDDLSIRSRLIDGGVAFEMAVSFKPDHPNRIYRLIHTPAADRALLRYVPADALLAGIINLGDGAARYDALMAFADKAVEIGRRTEPGKHHDDPREGMAELESVLNIDLRKELFANIQSIAAAVTAPDDTAIEIASAENDPGIAFALSSLVVIRTKAAAQFDETLTTAAHAIARQHLEDPDAEAAIVTEQIGDVTVKRYTVPGVDIVPVVARFEQDFVITLYEPLLHETIDVAQATHGGLSTVPQVNETLATLPDQASKLLLIRPDVLLNEVQRLDRAKHGDHASPTSSASAHRVQPMAVVHPMTCYTLENGDNAVLRIEVRDAPALLRHLMQLHKAEQRRHAGQTDPHEKTSRPDQSANKEAPTY